MKIIPSLITASVLLISVSSAQAQQICAPRGSAVMKLEKQFDERVFGRGLAANGQRMLELFVSKTGSWTVLVSDPNGHSCVMASGDNWQGLKQLAGDPA
jgi:hypothetical protein